MMVSFHVFLDDNCHAMFPTCRQEYKRKPRLSCWYKTIVKPTFTDADWVRCFRMPKSVFMRIKHELKRYIRPNHKRSNFGNWLSTGQVLSFAIRYLATGGSALNVANEFNSSEAAVIRAVHEVVPLICTLFASEITFPTSLAALRSIEVGFRARAAGLNNIGHGIAQVVGAIDGTHIAIRNPEPNNPAAAEKHFNRKKFTSINCQGVCDDKGVFIDVCVGALGCRHDSRMLKESSLWSAMKSLAEGSLAHILWSGRRIINGIAIPLMICGDAAYACTTYVLPSFRQSIANADDTGRKVIFNNKLAFTRNVVECAFGRLKARWRLLLKRMELLDENIIKQSIFCCFILHNMCERAKAPVQPMDAELLAQIKEFWEMFPDERERLNGVFTMGEAGMFQRAFEDGIGNAPNDGNDADNMPPGDDGVYGNAHRDALVGMM